MRETTRFIEGFVLGSLIGMALVLLTTPASGDELRSRVQNEVQRVRGEVNRAAATRRAELEQQLAALRKPR